MRLLIIWTDKPLVLVLLYFWQCSCEWQIDKLFWTELCDLLMLLNKSKFVSIYQLKLQWSFHIMSWCITLLCALFTQDPCYLNKIPGWHNIHSIIEDRFHIELELLTYFQLIVSVWWSITGNFQQTTDKVGLKTSLWTGL